MYFHGQSLTTAIENNNNNNKTAHEMHQDEYHEDFLLALNTPELRVP